MVKMKYFEAYIPSYAVSYIENNDPSGLEEEDVKAIDEYMEKIYGLYTDKGYSFSHVDWGEGDPSFTNYPDFGLPCNCYDVKIYYSKSV